MILRTGYAGGFHLAGQWFPKLARLTPEGVFVHFPFHPQAEFYADFGDYDVTLDVPADVVVGATGERIESRLAGDRRVERYRATAVHDFAFTAWSDFRESATTIDGVAVRVLFPPGHERNAEDTLDAVSFALPRASARYGRYPYPTLTVVHPPMMAAQAGGMEYPTLITTGGLALSGLLGDRAIQAVTVHELLHQWFYGLVATDEARFPFLDEGVTSYAEQRLLDEGWGPGSVFSGFGLELSATALGRAFAAERGEDASLALPAGEFPGFRTLAALVYSRTATVLETLARVYGRAELERGLGRYAKTERFQHPTPNDFVAALEAELGSDAARVLEQCLHQRGHVNYLVRDLQNALERTPGGVFDEQGTRTTVLEGTAVPERYRGRAVVVRHGSLELPVDVELVDERGNRTRQHWDGQGSFHVVEYRGEAPLAYVIVNPDRRVLLDDDLFDNAAAARADYPTRVLERTTYAFGLLVSLVGP